MIFWSDMNLLSYNYFGYRVTQFKCYNATILLFSCLFTYLLYQLHVGIGGINKIKK